MPELWFLKNRPLLPWHFSRVIIEALRLDLKEIWTGYSSPCPAPTLVTLSAESGYKSDHLRILSFLMLNFAHNLLVFATSVTRFGDSAPFGLFLEEPGANFKSQRAQCFWLFFGRFLKWVKIFPSNAIKGSKILKSASFRKIFKEICGNFH